MWPLHATRNRHLSEDRLIEAALAAQSDAFVPAPTAQTIHLRACDDCAARYEEIAAFLDNLAANVNADFDTVFTAERLLAQRQNVSRRLSRLLGLDPRARVLRFPSSGPPLPHAGASARRWMAAAAVACLVLGVAAGRLIPFPPRVPRPTGCSVRTAQPRGRGHRPWRADQLRRRGRSPHGDRGGAGEPSDLRAASDRCDDATDPRGRRQHPVVACN